MVAPQVIDEQPAAQLTRWQIWAILLVAGWGFFVDVYDSVLFAVVRVNSLSDLHVTGPALLDDGVLLLNVQMVGMIIGGLVWGVLGDKKGRKSALYGSIFLYSMANFANAFVHNVAQYAGCRFLSGVGLAGEVGAAMTIAAEVVPAQYRTYGTAFISVMGVLGSLFASIVGGTIYWRVSFEIAAVCGIGLLIARISTKESPVFSRMHSDSKIKRGSITMLLLDKSRLHRLLMPVLAMLPLFFVFGVLVSFAPEILAKGAEKQQFRDTVAGLTMMYAIGETSGEVISSLLSQFFRNRRRVMLGFVMAATILMIVILAAPSSLYAPLCLPLGLSVGYWGIVITATSEQFGTNLRSTATTLVPNLMRASVIPLNILFAILCHQFTGRTSAAILCAACIVLSFVAISGMQETFGKDLDFVES